ncbi:hypothetical protein CIHG_07984 [Coccidioides immitis H538.4]|uniref:Uncharacterized protein n=1 Tax=Coccidioides immitis H538.4 TaxID=396776 RepID=A0A0J8S1D9_COCIT|nr:hypothetical protein CIHG_07984 [Coccidioides immitis H538.4]
MPKETSSVNDKPDTLNGKVVKVLQEISTILKEIQKIQEMNFIAVSDIKNTLNNMLQLIDSDLCAALVTYSAPSANNSLPSHTVRYSLRIKLEKGSNKSKLVKTFL